MSGGITIVLQEKPVQKSKKALILLQKAQKKIFVFISGSETFTKQMARKV